jgi:hypothetical protein
LGKFEYERENSNGTALLYLRFTQLLAKRHFIFLQTGQPIHIPKGQNTLVIGAGIQHQQELSISPQEPRKGFDEVCVRGCHIEYSPALGRDPLRPVDARRQHIRNLKRGVKSE